MASASPEDIASALMASGRPADALKAIEPFASRPDAPHSALAIYSGALKALNRMDECLAIRRRTATRFPASGVAWHNLASVLGDLGSTVEAAQACRRAFGAGLDAPETWLILGRALVGEMQFDEAARALDQALRRRPGYPEALTEKAKLVWLRTQDIDAAAKVFPAGPEHALGVSGIYKLAGEGGRALEVLEEAVRTRPAEVPLLAALAGLATELGLDDRAEAAASEAVRLAPGDTAVLEIWAVTCLALGRSDLALASARQLVAAQPYSQSALALCAVAARLARAPEYARLYDYAAFVQSAEIAAPKGWPDAAAFLVDLKRTLDRLHDVASQPLGQSLRHGTQITQDLRVADDPVLKAFFAAIDPLILDYIARLGSGSDPLRARSTGRYALSGCWSIRLGPHGHHVDHMHPRGWLSSAFYVDVPKQTREGDDHQGWIQFGRPSFRTKPPLEPAHYVRPSPGRLVLFPSYMWHGTEPFTGEEQRLTIAFDAVPA
jgi:tetratricopeptide (TPR) repeat protein